MTVAQTDRIATIAAKTPVQPPWGEPHPFLDAFYPPLPADRVRKVILERGDEGADTLAEYVKQRERARSDAERDPLRHGWELGHWPDIRHMIAMKDETYVAGANGSAKTELAGKIIAEALCSRSRIRVLGIAQHEVASKTFQQAAVYKYLPPAARRLNEGQVRKRSTVTKINWSQAGGFTEATVVLPNRSQAWFRTVEQYRRDPMSFEGPEYDLVVIDEGCPLALVQTLRFRVGKRGGKLVYFLTSVEGYDPVFASEFEGARIVKTLPMQWEWVAIARAVAPHSGVLPIEQRGRVNPAVTFPELDIKDVQVKGCPPGHMPFIMQPLNFSHGVILPWTQWNPFLPKGKWNPQLPAVFDKCIGQPKWKVRVRLFGWIEKITGCKIGNFNPQIHVIPHERIAALLKAKRLTVYMADDPAIARSHFIAWKGVAEDGTEYIFDESPRYETEGEWVDANGEAGEGQSMYASMGVKWYKKHIREREREHGVEALLRWGDPRAFATKAAEASGARNLFELFCDDQSNEDPDYAPMYFEPAQIRQTVDMDLEAVVSKLAYDTARAERENGITVENQPHLFVSDRCQNVIRCWLNWDGAPDSPYKDGVDAAARYLFCTPGFWVDQNEPDAVGGRGWGR